MLKKNKKFLLSFLLFVFMVSILCPNTALAQTNDDVTAEITAEVFEDQTSAEVTVYIKNTGNEPVNNVQIQGILPEGLQLEDGSELIKKEETLTPGSETALQYVIKTEAKGEDDHQQEEVDTSAGIDQNNQMPSRDKNSTEKVSKVKTGDSANSVVLVIICIVTITVIIFICVRRKKGKGILSLLLCVAIIAPLMIGFSPVEAAETETGFHISKDMVLGGKTYTLVADVSYDLPEPVTPSGVILTRAQWIDELLVAVGAPEQEVVYENVELPFTDVAEHANKNEILLAYANQILPEIGTEFRPDAPVDREFAAVTAVKALGFQPIADIVCSDVSAITYRQEVETAVAMNIFTLDEEAFRPADELTRSEADVALNKIGEIANPEIPDSNAGELIFDHDVVLIPENAVYEISGTTITFTAGVDNLDEGVIFIMPDQTPYKAISVQKDGVALFVETEEPDISETLDSIEAIGTATVDAEQFIAAEGVTMVETQTTMASNVRTNIADVEGALTGLGNIDFKVNKEVGAGKLYGNISVSLPKVLYKADVDLGWSGFNVKDVLLKFPTDIKATGGFQLQNEDEAYLPDKYIPNGGMFELGKIPVVGIPGVAVYIQLSVKYDITGKIEVVWKIDGEAGIQILNNRLRTIRNLESDLDLNALGGTAKIGPALTGLLEICRRWDLIDISLSVGPAASGEMIVRNPSFVCVDGSVYLYGEFSAMDEGVIGDWLDIGYSLDFWDSGSSPLKVNAHFENFVIVDECTYDIGNGSLAGMVAKASDQRTPIEGAAIVAYQENNGEAINTVLTDAYGNYSMNLRAGDYTIQISAPGYMTFEYNVTITEDEEKYAETFLMVDEGQEGQPGEAAGRITDAITGDSIEGVIVTLRKGWNQTSGDVVATAETDQSGRYLVQASIGNYTATVEKDGYVTNRKNIVVMSESVMDQNVTMNPTGQEVENANVRVVLTWGDTPRDLDSHLLGPTIDGSDYFHVYFGDKRYEENSIKVADLDVDDTSSYGPETTSLYKKNESGNYSFYVHDYTNGGDVSSVEMSQSGAIVEVYLDGAFYKAYPVPTGQAGVNWHVFDYDAATNTIKDINRFVDDITYLSQVKARAIAVVPMERTK